MAYSTDPDKSIVPAKIRHRILTLEEGESIRLAFATEQQAKNMYQAIRCFLIGHDKIVPKAEHIASKIKTTRIVGTLVIKKQDLGILGMEL